MIKPVTLQLVARTVSNNVKVKEIRSGKFELTFQKIPIVSELLELGKTLQESVSKLGMQGYWLLPSKQRSRDLAWNKKQVIATAYSKNQRKQYLMIED